uniref:Uncharacterized protein n=1 Tax=Oryza nivara TaxID=4536 RepID=A0A0E0FRG9_ORYNI
MPNSSERNPPQLLRLQACDQEMINRLFALITQNTSIRVQQTTAPEAPSGKSILMRSPTAKIESPVFQKAALTEDNPKA